MQIDFLRALSLAKREKKVKSFSLLEYFKVRLLLLPIHFETFNREPKLSQSEDGTLLMLHFSPYARFVWTLVNYPDIRSMYRINTLQNILRFFNSLSKSWNRYSCFSTTTRSTKASSRWFTLLSLLYFADIANSTVKFDKKGDGLPRYIIYNYQKAANGKTDYKVQLHSSHYELSLNLLQCNKWEKAKKEFQGFSLLFAR